MYRRSTPIGEAYFSRCVAILADIEDAEASLTDFGRVPKGTVRINSTPGFVKHRLLPLVNEFQELYPQLTVDLIGEGVD